jgi:hypothetical protein
MVNSRHLAGPAESVSPHPPSHTGRALMLTMMMTVICPPDQKTVQLRVPVCPIRRTVSPVRASKPPVGASNVAVRGPILAITASLNHISGISLSGACWPICRVRTCGLPRAQKLRCSTKTLSALASNFRWSFCATASSAPAPASCHRIPAPSRLLRGDTARRKQHVAMKIPLVALPAGLVDGVIDQDQVIIGKPAGNFHGAVVPAFLAHGEGIGKHHVAGGPGIGLFLRAYPEQAEGPGDEAWT